MDTAVSAIIVVRNEEKNVPRCFESLRWVGEIVVVDQSSTDDTVNICKKYTDKIFITPPKGFCEPDRALAVEKAANDWIFYIDADEVVSPELASEIRELLMAGPEYDCYYIRRKNIFLKKWIKGSGWYPGEVLRLFKKGSVRFSEDIHTGPIPLKKAGCLKGHIIHYTCDNLKEYVEKSNNYISILAGQSYAKGDRLSWKNFIWRLFVLPAVYFLHRLIFKMGIRDGFHGLLIALLTLRTVFLKNLKLWEMQRDKRKV